MSTGSSLVPYRASPGASVPAQPVTDDQLYVLFTAMMRFPAYFQEVRERLRPEYFDNIYEPHWQLLLLALRRCYDRYAGANYNTAMQAAIDEMRENPAIVLTHEQGYGLFSEDANNPGVIQYIYGLHYSQIGPDTVNMANEVLQRFLFERTVVSPMRRLMNTGFSTPGAYPADLGVFLEGFVEQHRRLSAPNRLPIVSLAPPPGTILRPACDYVPTGLPMFDTRFNGQRRGDVNGIIGVTGGAKTTLCSYMAVLAGQLAWQLDNTNCEQVAFVTYEEPMWRLRPRFQSAAMRIPRDTLERLTDANHLSRVPVEYERGMLQAPATEMASEFDRYVDASVWLNQAVVAFDLSGTDEHPTAGQGYVQEVSNLLMQQAQRTGRGFRSVFLDYAGLACDRYMAAQNYDEGKLRHLLRTYGEQCKKLIAEKFNCTVWVAHQIRGEACNKNPTVLLHHNDAAEAKSFAENMALCGCIGAVDRNTGCRVLNFSKVRYKAQERIPPATFRINDTFAMIDDVTTTMVADASGSRFVSREEADRIHGREQRAATTDPPISAATRGLVDPMQPRSAAQAAATATGLANQ